jgi:hypothetical protein
MDSFSEDDHDDLLCCFMRTKRYRTYDLVFVNGEPRFVRSEFDQSFEEALNAAYGELEDQA